MKRKKSPRKQSGQKKRDNRATGPSNEDIIAVLRETNAPTSLREIADNLQITEKDTFVALRKTLQLLAKQGRVMQTRGHHFGLPERMDLLSGSVIGHPDGYSFVSLDQGGDDVYLAQRESRRVLHGDRVLVRSERRDRRGRLAGSVVEILERGNESIVGRYFREGGIGFVTPDNRRINQDILIPKAPKNVRHGQIVVVTIVQQPDVHTQPIGEIAEVLGDHMAPGMEIEIATRSFDIPVEWPEEVQRELQGIPVSVSVSNFPARRDLTELPLITIDGEDARDFDDAVFCRASRGGYTLYVAIADVAHYIKENSALDVEARQRGTSVYFPGSVIPMLPEQLSNGICSLNPNVERLAMVCEMRFDGNGERLRYRFYDAVIRSHARLTYEEVAERLSRAAKPVSGTLDYHLSNLQALWRKLAARRANRGALEFESNEPVFTFDDQQKIAAIGIRRRNDAHRMIEEAMIAANVSAADDLIKHRRAGLFRNHARPADEKIEAIREFLGTVGLKLGGGNEPSAKDFAVVLAKAQRRPDQPLIETVLMRGQKLAEYHAENSGHFGLALDAYSHFTSPIRRYPDLVVHRAIKQRLARAKQSEETAAAVFPLAQHCSMTERRAEEATRDVNAWLKCEFMVDKIGDPFKGTVTGVTSFGLFIELDDIFVEGLLHVTSLPRDYYEYDDVRHELNGSNSKARYRIGQTINVVVAGVSVEERKIDFAMPEVTRRARRKRR